MKIQAKTTILFTVLTSTFFVILGVVVYYFVDEAAHRDFNKRVELRARISAKFRFEQGEVSTESFREIQRKYLERLADETAFIFKVDSGGKQFSPKPPPEIPLPYLAAIIEADSNTVYRENKFRHYAGILYKDETGNYIVIKSATNQYGSELMTELRNIMIFTMVCAIAVICIIGYYFSKRTFRPFRVINNKVNQINENNLHLRLEPIAGTDEIAELVRTFNQMIDRIEMAFETQNNFISNASHELRTPLTAILGETDYILSRERTPEEYKKCLQQIVMQAEKLQALTKGLLNLAQTGFDGKKIDWNPVRLDELIYAVKENMDFILPDNKVKVHMKQVPDDENKMFCTGSFDLLKVAVGNIVLNACKYSNNNEVMLELYFNTESATITVSDRGIGIPPEDMKHIYDPFFRASNTHSYEGYGIGMPLSYNIIRLHKGRIDVESRPNEGTTVHIHLPLEQRVV
jgi:signal transduction histidine kinase